jgi:hypothetical protein
VRSGHIEAQRVLERANIMDGLVTHDLGIEPLKLRGRLGTLRVTGDKL